MGVRVVCVVVGVLCAAVSCSATAQAAVCGSNVKGGEPPRAALTLAADSVTTQNYGRHVSNRSLLLIFRANGCELPATPAPLTFETLPKQDSDDLPVSALQGSDVAGTTAAGVVTPSADGRELSVKLSIDEHDLDPGTYNSLITVRGSYIATARVPVSVSRSENRIQVPFLIGAGAGFAAFFWLLLFRLAARDVLQVPLLLMAAIALAQCVVGGVAAVSAWADQDVWTLGDNVVVTLVTGFTAATTGAVATALVGSVWQARTTQPATGEGSTSAERQTGSPPVH